MGLALALRLAVCTVLVAVVLTAGRAAGGFDPADLDPSCPACRDFNRFAVGGWLDRHPIPPDRSDVSTFGEVAARNAAISRQILEDAAADANATGDEKKIGDLYASCMDEAGIERAGLAPLTPILSAIAGIRDLRSLEDETARLHGIGIDVLWRAASATDPRDSRKRIPLLGVGALGIPSRDYYLGDDQRSLAIRDAYVRYAATLFALAGDAKSQAATEAQTVLEIETRLARAELAPAAARDPRNAEHHMQRAQLAQYASHVDWDRYFAERAFPRFTVLEVGQPQYFQVVDQLLATLPLEELKTYLRWRALASSAEGLPKRVADADFAFQRTLTGVDRQLSRPLRCTRLVDRLMGDALGRLWVARAFSLSAKVRAERMAEELKAVLADDLRSLPWMSDSTRREALAKLAAMRLQIGYPVRWRDYGALAIARGEYLENVRAASAFRVRDDVAKVGRPVDLDEFPTTAQTTNAFYLVLRNEIVVPAGILQPPFFSDGADDASNYGAIGAIIGHEMTHAFDNLGRQFDARGNLRDWWTADDAANFEARARCIIDQAADFPAPDGIAINGELVQGEAIADLGGLTLAYEALQRRLGNGARTPLDGYTPEQRFFIAYARYSAARVRPERERTLSLSDPHPPAVFRIDATVANVPQFAQAFACVAGDAMVRPPAERCKIW